MTALHGAGPQTAGMLRIQKGQEERHVWPVHLSGWLGLGWRVAGAEAPTLGIAAAEPPAPSAAAAADLLDQDDAKPASTRGRRGRRRKDEALPVEPADTGASTVSDKSDSDAMGPEPNNEPADLTEPPASAIEALDPDTAAEVPMITALPDDLFDDPLI